MHLSLTEALQQAVLHHQAGRLADAEQLYRAILGMDPRQPDACHNLGVMAMQVGQPSAGLSLLRQAVEIAPAQPAFWTSLIDCALQAGEQAFAREAFAAARAQRIPEAALARFAGHLATPPSADISAVLAFFNNARHDDGEAAARRITTQFPGFPWGWKALGLFYQLLGKPLPAAAALRRSAALEPADIESYSNLGDALRVTGSAAAALACYRHALALDASHAGAHNNLGIVHQEMRDFDLAAASYRRALSLDPGLAKAYDNLGSTLRLQRRFDASLTQHRHAIVLVADDPDFLNNEGAALKEADNLAAAEPRYLAALALMPAHANTWHNLAGLRYFQRDLPAAETAARRAICLMPDHVEAHRRLADALLTTGRYDEGWREYEWRKRVPQDAATWNRFGGPEWQGEDAPGRTLLVYGEQGFGDVLQTCRFIPMVARRGLRVVFEVRAPLARLMAGLAGVDHVVTGDAALPAYDLQCSVMSLPRLLDITLDTLPGETPYIAVPPDMTVTWRRRVDAAARGRLKIGLQWSGNPLMPSDRRRSIAPELLAPLGKIPGLCFFSLQKDYAGLMPPLAPHLLDLMDQATDFADTAALIAGLDLVIAVDSAIAHLAGAIGRPVWLLARRDADWRWLDGREDSPWYPQMRIFHQVGLGPAWWPEVMARLRAALAEFAAANAPAINR